jgi:hypothetical protein
LKLSSVSFPWMIEPCCHVHRSWEVRLDPREIPIAVFT